MVDVAPPPAPGDPIDNDLKEANGGSENDEGEGDKDKGKIMVYPCMSGKAKFDISFEACEPFGFFFGDRVECKQYGPAWVIGVSRAAVEARTKELFFHWDMDKGASCFAGCGPEGFRKRGIKLLFSHQQRADTRPRNYFAPQLGTLLQGDRSFSDVTFVVGEEKKVLQAHRNILVSRSKYFEAMLLGGMRESSSQEPVVTMADSDPVAFQIMLEFLYTGELKLSATDHEQFCLVFELADKYQLDKLKELCIDQLAGVVSTDNVASLLLFSDKLSADTLKTACKDYFTSHYENVIQTTGFVALATAKPALLQEVLGECTRPRKRQRTR
jgi:hypothetical protein